MEPSHLIKNLAKLKTGKINKKNLFKWIEKFAHVPILVVGDLMLDRTLTGSVDRISPEAPVPVLKVKDDEWTLGGAGNVINNLSTLGAIPTLIAVRGKDTAGERLERQFREQSLNSEGLVIHPTMPTIRKIRVRAGTQQIVRIDFEKNEPLEGRSLSEILQLISKLVPSNRAVIVSDYGKGVVSPPVIKKILKETRKKKIFVSVDPKIEHFFQYKGVDCLTPNSKEAVEGMRAITPTNEKGFVELGKQIMKKLQCKSLLLTRGEKGLMSFVKNGPLKKIKAQAKEVYDVTGAGDTVISTFTLARAVGAPHSEAAQIANFAAAMVVGKIGTACVTQKDLSTYIKQIRTS